MRIRGIARETLKFILEVCKSTHPNEFVGLLEQRDGIIYNVIVLPGTHSSRSGASIRLDMLPLGMSTVGSVHSHPSGDLTPSQTDLSMFSRKGWVHMIVAYPYDERSWAFYDHRGEKVEMGVMEVEWEEEGSCDWNI